MILTSKGMDILADLYAEFRSDWVERFPGCNENDVERNFLYTVYQGMNDSHYIPPQLEAKIEQIR